MKKKNLLGICFLLTREEKELIIMALRLQHGRRELEYVGWPAPNCFLDTQQCISALEKEIRRANYGPDVTLKNRLQKYLFCGNEMAPRSSKGLGA